MNDLLVQWARGDGTDWEAFPLADWPILPDNPIASLCYQGVVFCADRYAVEQRSDGGARITVVCDDSRYYQDPYARIVELPPLAPDPAFGDAINTRITQQVFADLALPDAAGAVRQSWASYAPGSEVYRSGLGMADALWLRHVEARSVRGWREWTHGLAAVELQGGRVKPQRAQGRYDVPRGTRTYYCNNVALASGAHAANNELAAEISPGGLATVASGNIGTSGALIFAFSSPTNEPDQVTWPTGDYRCQIDVVTASLDSSFGALTQGTAGGHFARVDSALAADVETKTQQEAAFVGVGLKLATTGSVSWADAAQSDRWEVLIAAVRNVGHGNDSLTLELGESDDFTDGPWVAAPMSPTSEHTLSFFRGGGL